MIQTENTAIVLRHANYRDNDRMVTLLSPSRGRIDAIIRNCRKPKSHNLNSGELFALGDYMLHENGGHVTVTSVKLIETFYPLRNDYDRLTCGVYLLGLAEAVAEPEQFVPADLFRPGMETPPGRFPAALLRLSGLQAPAEPLRLLREKAGGWGTCLL